MPRSISGSRPVRSGFPGCCWAGGIAVATHALALLLRKTRRRERIFIDKCARSSTVHLFAYVAVVLLLFLVNLTVTPKAWWFYWVALGWGAGLIPHAWSAFFRHRPAANHEAKSSAEARPRKRLLRRRRAKPS
ncbi:MAG: 2TM domain-containing protein [Methyloceanibacter sp.]